MEKQQILSVLPKNVRLFIEKQRLVYECLQEIRLRIGQPLLLKYQGKEKMAGDGQGAPCLITKEDIQEMMGYISNYSLYAYEEEMKQGFITIEGGHRVGMTGQAIIENGKVKNIKYVSSINLRMAHEVPGCADKVFPYVTYNKQLYHTLIVSPPGCGKTTLLRDMIRQISDGNQQVRGMAVGVVDERSELGGCYMGVPQNCMGMRTDILDGCPKAEGMIMLIRSMGPEVIAVDEIGEAEDVHAIEYAMHCGCRMIATAHGTSMEEMRKKPLFQQMILKQQFERYVVLGETRGSGQIAGIYDKRGSLLFQEKGHDQTDRRNLYHNGGYIDGMDGVGKNQGRISADAVCTAADLSSAE